jgi:branched-chain amino acid transport system substrate-binding protein
MKFGLAGSTTFSQPPFLSLAGNAANGVYAITDFVGDNDSAEIVAWKKLYSGVYGEAPELYSSTYYDAMNLLAWAMNQAASITGPDIREALTKVHDLPGVMTRYSWSASGDMVHSGLITVIKNQRPTVVSVVTA